MKGYIIGSFVLVIMLFSNVFQSDHNNRLLAEEYVKETANTAANAAALYYEADEYGKGKIVYNQAEGDKAVQHVVRSFLKLDDGLNPLDDSYCTEQVVITTQYFDDSNTVFPYMYNDTEIGFSRLIVDPQVVVKINIGKPRYRLKFIVADNLVRSSAFKYFER